DLVCLQEVDAEIFAAIAAALAPLGYAGHYAAKDGGKPDGCASFLRAGAAELIAATRLAFADGRGAAPNSGHIAQLIRVSVDGCTLGIANTHLKWSPSNVAPE